MKRFLIMICVLFSIQMTMAQVEVEGVMVPEKLTMEGQDMVLNGAGVRSKYFMDLYVGSLFVPEKESNAQKIIDANKGMLIQLDIISGLITSEKMTDAINEGFENSVKPIKEDVSSEVAAFKSVFKEEIEKGDNFQFLYVPEKGVQVYKNGSMLKVIDGLPFKRALFGIWLCDTPADKKLKKKMVDN